MKWITSTRILQWADNRESEERLPELIRKLILSTCKNLSQLSMPIGDSIFKPGWDGYVNSNSSSLYVPQGQSYWEMGRNKDFMKKAEDDFSKRTYGQSDEPLLNSVFIFVTPRRWINKEKWINNKLKEGIWKEVRVYDADDLECWIEMTPAVGIWLAKQFGINTEKIESCIDYWNRWASTSKFILTPELIISGRTSESLQVSNFINGNSGILELQVSSKEEGLGFVISSVINCKSHNPDCFFSKAIIVQSSESLKRITRQYDNLIILYINDNDDPVSPFEVNSNIVISLISYRVKTNGLVIPIPKWRNFIKSLEDLGMDFEAADKLASDSGRSFSILKRILNEFPGRVSWTEENNLLQLLSMFFVGRFDDHNIGDQEIIEEFCGEKYENFKIILKKWSVISDAPVYQSDHFFRTVSSYDLLHVLAPYITEQHLDRFKKIFLQVLLEIDPALELGPKMRFVANILQKRKRYSESIRDGLCQTLLLLSVHGETSGIKLSYPIQNIIDEIVANVLDNLDLQLLQSLSSKIQLLAEASPEAFIKCLENLIKKKSDVLIEVFNESESNIFTPRYYSNLLSALEALCWDPEYIARVSLILFKIVPFDHNKNLSNRPLNSLRNIFSYCFPQTYSSIYVRQQILELLLKQNHDIGFELIKIICPENHEFLGSNSKPIWRLRDVGYNYPTKMEINQQLDYITERLINTCKNDAIKWSQIVEKIDDFYGLNRRKIIEALKGIEDFINDVSFLRESLRIFIYKHEQYTTMDWAIEKSEVEDLKIVYNSITNTKIDKYYWYFDVDFIENPTSNENSWKLKEQETKEKRIELLTSILNDYGWEGILQLIYKVKNPELAGDLLGEFDDSFVHEIIILLNSSDHNLKYFAIGYVSKISELKNFEWVKIKANFIKESFPDILLNFFLAVVPSCEVWKLIEVDFGEIQEDYWNKAFKGRGLGLMYFKLSNIDKIKCIKTLNQYHRYITSINLIRLDRDELPVDVIIETLEGMATHPLEKDIEVQGGRWLIEQLFKRLDKENIDEAKIQQLEWNYVEILEESEERPIKFLTQYLNSTPSFFAEVISCMYKSEDGKEILENIGMDKKSIAHRARKADKLLESWVVLPGETSDGVNFEILKAWIDDAIIECAKRNRRTRGIYQIGKLLGKMEDGNVTWPDDGICEIIEEHDEEELGKGFVTGVVNGKGVSARIISSNDDSYEIERINHFNAISVKYRYLYPKMSLLLNRVIEIYKRRLFFNQKDKEFNELNL